MVRIRNNNAIDLLCIHVHGMHGNAFFNIHMIIMGGGGRGWIVTS
jgi:hypothetical protein